MVTYVTHYKAAALAAKLADTCVSASFLPDLWSTYYERFHGVLSAEFQISKSEIYLTRLEQEGVTRVGQD